MAVSLVHIDPQTGIKRYTCLSGDVKPTSDVVAGSQAYETDTGDIYTYNGASWALDARNGAELVDINSAWPAEWRLAFAGTAANVNDNTTVYVSPDVSMFNHHEFSVVTAPGANSIEVHVSHDGTNWEDTAVQVVDRALVVGAAVQSLAQITAVGNYYFDGKFALIRIINNGATTGAAASVRGSHSVI